LCQHLTDITDKISFQDRFSKLKLVIFAGCADKNGELDYFDNSN